MRPLQRSTIVICLVLLALLLTGIELPALHTPVSAAAGGPAPILLVVNGAYPANPFGAYLGEILRAEGLNEFDTLDISALTSADLTQHQLTILAETTLTSGQAQLLSDYVTGGGRLLAMRPDAQIKALFGLGSFAGVVNNGYLLINGGSAWNGQNPGLGLSASTLQIHGAANEYGLLPGAVSLAQLYSDANTATSFAAVVGDATGRAAAFNYDLASDVALTRQGNPASANLDVDGDGITRTIDLFQTPGNPGAPWIDRTKIPIPQADEHQRLFARLVQQLVAASQPLPQLWYFPDTAKTMLIVTGDAHANPTSYFQNEINSLTAHGGTATFYLSIAGEPNDASVQAWRAQGYTFGIHPYGYQPNPGYPPFDIQNLAEGFNVYDNWWSMTYSSPKSRTVRIHQLRWLGWTDAADLEVAHGLALDTDFYHWGTWLQNPDGTWPHGYMTGSGQPMKFIRADGTVLPLYQQLTELVDEQLINGAGDGWEGLNDTQALTVSRQLIDASLAGDYAALMTQFHVDYYGDTQAWAEGTLDYANANGVPIWNADQWLNFVETRHDANYSSLSWDAATGTLSFQMAAAGTAGVDLTTILPLNYGGNSLQSVAVDGAPASYSVQTINGQDVAFVSVSAGNHSFSAAYQAAAPTASPTLTATPTVGPSPTATNTSLPSSTPTNTPTATATPLPSATPTATNTGLPTNTPTNTPTATITPLPSATPTASNTPSSTPTVNASLPVTLTAQVAASSDDANQDGSSLDLGSSTVWLGDGASVTSSYTGLRFTNLAIPPGAIINSARLQLYSSQSQWLSINLSLAAEAVGNSATFSAGSTPSQRALTTQKVAHSSDVSWSANTWVTFDEMAPVVQELVNRADWHSGNSVSFIMRGTGNAWGRKFVASFDGSAITAPELVIVYTGASAPTSTPTAAASATTTPTNTATAVPSATASPTVGPSPTATNTSLPTNTPTNTPTATITPLPSATPTASNTPSSTPTVNASLPVTLTAQVAASSDDANQDGSSLDLGSSTVWLGDGASVTSSYTGLRFTNLAIPPGAIINSARLQLYSSQSQWLSINLSLAAEAVGNSATFSAGSTPSQRALTTQKVAHSSDVSWSANTWVTFDEMAPVVQELVNRADWHSGNSVSFIMRGTGNAWGRKFVASFDGSAITAPELVIVYTAASAPTSTPVATVTSTATPTPTAAATATATSSPAPTATQTSTAAATSTPTAGSTATPTPAAATSSPTAATATPTPPASATATVTSSNTPVATSTPTNTPLPTATASATPTLVPTSTAGIFAFQGGGSQAFWRFDLAGNNWTLNATTIAPVNQGGALTYNGANLYALSGGGQAGFWSNNPAAISWVASADAPAGVGDGGALTALGASVYALGGNNTTSFWRYDAASNGWTALAHTPASIGAGGALTNDGTSIYAFRGNGTRTFWRYSVVTNSWTTLSSAPASVSSGGALVRVGNFIYAFRGQGTTTFWRYNLTSNTWASRASAPAAIAAGGALTTDGTNLYALEGNLLGAFWRYSVSANSWAALPPAPGNVAAGGALVFVH